MAGAIIENFRPAEIYVADLDAIDGEEPAWPTLADLQCTGMSLWVDAGVREIEQAIALADAGISGIVCGLESLAGPESLRGAIGALGADRIILSLDLKNGRPLGNPQTWKLRDHRDATTLVATAVELGIRRLIVLDLARVGEGQGVGTLDLCRRISTMHPHLEIATGGGVRGPNDLAEMERAGVQAALVASALHDGRIKGRRE